MLLLELSNRGWYFFHSQVCQSISKFLRRPTEKTFTIISMGLCKKDITPVLTHWSYVFLALTHRSVNWEYILQFNYMGPLPASCHMPMINIYQAGSSERSRALCWIYWCSSFTSPYWSGWSLKWKGYIDDLVQDCSNYSALAMELLQSCTKPLI